MPWRKSSAGRPLRGTVPLGFLAGDDRSSADLASTSGDVIAGRSCLFDPVQPADEYTRPFVWTEQTGIVEALGYSGDYDYLTPSKMRSDGGISRS
jgi:hypothetical protein